jgi:hypothetical protein
MDLQQVCPQCADIAYIRVGRDARESAVWEVVTPSEVIQTYSGPRAIEICEAMRHAKELPIPEA